MGAEVNAGTGKETTSVYSRFLDEHLERAFDVMPGHGAAPRVPGHRLRAPGGDRGDRHVRGRAPGQGARRARRGDLRRPPAGPAGHRPRRGDRRRCRCRTSPPTTTRATCPAASWWPRPATSSTTRLVALVERRLRRRARRRRARRAARLARRRRPHGCASTARTPSSTTSASARRASRATTTAASRCAMLDTILGGSTSSRLFQEVREKRGLAYSVYSYASQYADTGQVGDLRGHPPGQRRRGARGDRRRAARGCIEDGVTEEELSAPARTSRAARCSRWSPRSTRMNRLGQLGADGHAAADARRGAGARSTPSRSTT